MNLRRVMFCAVIAAASFDASAVERPVSPTNAMAIAQQRLHGLSRDRSQARRAIVSVDRREVQGRCAGEREARKEGEGWRRGRLGPYSDAVASQDERRGHQDRRCLGTGGRAAEVSRAIVGGLAFGRGGCGIILACWVSSAGRASRSRCEGREFAPPLHHEFEGLGLNAKPFFISASTFLIPPPR